VKRSQILKTAVTIVLLESGNHTVCSYIQEFCLILLLYTYKTTYHNKTETKSNLHLDCKSITLHVSI